MLAKQEDLDGGGAGAVRKEEALQSWSQVVSWKRGPGEASSPRRAVSAGDATTLPSLRGQRDPPTSSLPPTVNLRNEEKNFIL